MKSLKTPLRWPGGKSRAIKYLLPKFPKDISEYREPFIGGGSVAIAFTKEHPNVPVWINDLYYPLYNFWKTLQSDGEKLSNTLLELKQKHNNQDKAKNLFIKAKEEINYLNDSDLAAAYFYVLNKCSFSGLTESSSFSKLASDQNFTVSGIEKLPKYSEIIKNWKITNLDYQHMVYTNSPVGTFWFFDPPYDIKDNLYGNKGNLHKSFNHKTFHSMITQNIKDEWMITYNDNETLREWYNNYYCNTWDLTYTMRSTGSYNQNQKSRYELLITSYEV
jgi:DNA adenine methylase